MFVSHRIDAVEIYKWIPEQLELLQGFLSYSVPIGFATVSVRSAICPFPSKLLNLGENTYAVLTKWTLRNFWRLR
jgi:hypothetical protein